MLGAAAMLQPAHDRLVLAQLLHPVNAQVEVVLLVVGRAFGHDQRPGDQRRRLAGPAALDRQAVQIDIIALQHHFLAGRLAHIGRAHAHDGLGQRQHAERVLEAARRFGLAQKGQSSPTSRRSAAVLRGSPPSVTARATRLHRAEQIDQGGHFAGAAVFMHRVFKQHRRPAGFQKPGLDLGHLQMGGDRTGDPLEIAVRFQR
jgi:hypothetical protein